MKRMNNLKNVIAARIMGGLVIGMTAVAGVAPVTVFAQSQEAECICEEKCSQDSINEECAVWKMPEGCRRSSSRHRSR